MAHDPSLALAIRRHSFLWLVAANAIGVLLGVVLLWPDLGDRLAPFTYGRWMPLHLNWQLYGWCSLPLVGVLLAWFSANTSHARAGTDPRSHISPALPGIASRSAIWGWSAALAAGGISWLQGITSGKLFVDWHGWARPALSLAMMLLWAVLGTQLWWQRRTLNRPQIIARLSAIVLLAPVPAVIYWAAGRDVYPSVNPDSGGATGASLLGSTLGIIAIYGFLPAMLSVPAKNSTWVSSRVFWGSFFISALFCAAMNHSHASHHTAGQILGLALLLVWVPLVWFYFLRFDWDPGSRAWLLAAFGWWLLLVVTGLLTFLPGFSERLKFTHGLVAHAHLAMAGFVTSINRVILNQLAPAHSTTRGFLLWQGGCALLVASMLGLGWLEGENPGALFRSEGWTDIFLIVRLLGGVAM